MIIISIHKGEEQVRQKEYLYCQTLVQDVENPFNLNMNL
jgi:hypothetical protein